MALITCKNLSLAYEGSPVVSNLNFSVEKGDYLCIIGENGSGKTTLLKTLLGLHAASAGELTFGDGLKRTEIGYLPQQSAIQRDFPASVFEVVLSGMVGRCGFGPFYTKEQKRLARQIIGELELTALANRSYRQLSGGQQQRVLIARALCASSKLLILDEPVSGLDPDITAEMYDLIGKINRSGITIIMVSHDLDAALSRANKILHVGNGFFGTPGDYMMLKNKENDLKGELK